MVKLAISYLNYMILFKWEYKDTIKLITFKLNTLKEMLKESTNANFLKKKNLLMIRYNRFYSYI